MTQETKHTPTPWALLDESKKHGYHGIYNADGLQVAKSTWSSFGKPGRSMQDESMANALFIVRACNAYNDLVDVAYLFQASLEYYIKKDSLSGDDEGATLKSVILATVRSVIAKARGEA